LCDSPEETLRWKAIANALRSELAEGRNSPGDKLPTEAALSAHFGVNRHTVRHGFSFFLMKGWFAHGAVRAPMWLRHRTIIRLGNVSGFMKI
jgi:hypothetical protein